VRRVCLVNLKKVCQQVHVNETEIKADVEH